MFADARAVEDGARLEADLCIVGGGAAGITLAREFASTATRVLVLESGGLAMDAQAQSLADGEVAGLRYFPLMAARLRYFGGTTNHWGGVCRPFDPRDFASEEEPHARWPIRMVDLRAYFARASTICGLAGFDALSTPAAHADLPPAFQAAFEPHHVERVPDARRRFAPNHHDELAGAANVRVLLHANVLEVETDEDARRVTGLRVTSFAGNRFTVAAHTVVLAAGGIDNARLLLLSRSRRPAGLGNDHDLVGRYFLEHPRFVAGIVLPAEGVLPPRAFEWRRVGGAAIQTYLRLNAEVRRREAIGRVLLRFEAVHAPGASAKHTPAVGALRRLTKAVRRGRLRRTFDDDVATVFRDLTTWQRSAVPGAPLPVPRPELVREALATKRRLNRYLPAVAGAIPAFAAWKLGDAPPVTHYRVTAILVPVPNASSRVTLSAATDALGQPRARLDWRLGADDYQSARRMMEILGAEIGRLGAGRLKMRLGRDGDAWPDDLHGGYHHMGTTRMSDDPRTGVVDRDCRVHGMANLYVAGSSTFCTAGSGTPTLALVALTLRLADTLKEEALA